MKESEKVLLKDNVIKKGVMLMRKRLSLLSLASALICCLIFSGNAGATMIFDFTGGPLNLDDAQTSIGFTDLVSGVTLTATARKQSGQSIYLTQNSSGLGATYDGDNGLKLDSVGPNEVLEFSISGLAPGSGFVLDAIEFGSFSILGNDTFNFKIDGLAVTTPPNEFNPGVNPWVLAGSPEFFEEVARTAYSDFLFKATPNDSVNGESAFRIKSISAHIAPAPVPEPSTILLLSSGLAGLAFYARRRRKE